MPPLSMGGKIHKTNKKPLKLTLFKLQGIWYYTIKWYKSKQLLGGSMMTKIESEKHCMELINRFVSNNCDGQIDKLFWEITNAIRRD